MVSFSSQISTDPTARRIQFFWLIIITVGRFCCLYSISASEELDKLSNLRSFRKWDLYFGSTLCVVGKNQMAAKVAEKAQTEGFCWWMLVFLIGAIVVSGATFTLLKKVEKLKKNHTQDHPTAIVEDYATALKLAMKFFDIQKSGKLENNRIAWRGDSGLGDGTEENLDLSKGLYDAGDLIKFGFPLAFTATVLSWAILEYGDNLKETKQLDYAQDSLKWITDYLINAHPSPNLLYIQVGDPELDHRCWQRPENMTERRPLTQINSSHPGTEVAAETAAAMASASLVFKKINSSYSDLLIKHSEQLFSFADFYRGSYSISIPSVQKYYNSSGYGDELLWAATWLYFATGDGSYLRYVTEQNGEPFSGWEDPSWFSWDDKHSGIQVLLSRVELFGRGDNISTVEDIDLQIYSKSAEAIMCELLPDSPTATSSRTKSGLIWVESYNSLQHSVASAFLALLFSDYMVASEMETMNCAEKLYGPDDLRNFASSQADYVLGKNPMEMSYLVGHGSRYPEFVHHRGASIPVDAETGCADGFKWLESIEPNPNVAVGALVGGPFLNESYIDMRNNSKQGEPCTYSNALLVGLLSGLVADYSVIRPF